jgi:hypothetical protein
MIFRHISTVISIIALCYITLRLKKKNMQIECLQQEIMFFNDYMDDIQSEGERLPETLYDRDGNAYAKINGRYGDVTYQKNIYQ